MYLLDVEKIASRKVYHRYILFFKRLGFFHPKYAQYILLNQTVYPVKNAICFLNRAGLITNFKRETNNLIVTENNTHGIIGQIKNLLRRKNYLLVSVYKFKDQF